MNEETLDPRPRIPGSVHVRRGVIDKVAREAAAAAIGVARGDVHAESSEWAGGLAVRIAAKLPVPRLDDEAAINAATPVIDRARALQTTLAADLARLTGRGVQRVTLTVTGAVVPERRRVR